MLSKGFRLLSVRGIDIRIDASWLIIAALVTWSFWGRFTSFHDRGGKVALVMAVVGAALFFVSVLVHELAHAFEARRRGVHVGGITLFLFGGVTESRFDVKRPVDEFALTAVGPFTSFVVGASLGLIATGADAFGLGTVAEVAGLVGWINIALGAFNLLPGAPLDGGRLLRAAVWWWTGDRRRSISVAATAGRLLGSALMALGIVQLLFVPGAFAGGVWLAFIGWFLSRAAAAEQAQSELAELLGDVPTRRLTSNAAQVAHTSTVGDLVDRWMEQDTPDVLAVRDDGRVVGAVSVDQARAVPPDERDRVRVDSIMTSVDSLPSVDADAPASEVLDAMAEEHLVIVTENGQAAGLVTVDRMISAARRAERLAAEGPGKGSAR